MSTVSRLVVSACLVFTAATGLAAPPATAGPSLALQKQDLAAARAFVLGSHAFSDGDQAVALARIEVGLARTAPWSPAGFLVEVMRIAALAHNGHDSVHTHGGWSPDRRLPLRLAWLSDGLVVTRAAADQVHLLGRRVAAFDGHGLEEVLRVLRQVNGGTDEYIRWNDTWMLEHPDMLHALGLAEHPDRVTLQLQGDRGGIDSQEVFSVPSSAVPHDTGRLGLWSRELSRDEQRAGWASAVTAAEDPVWLRERQRQFRLVELPSLNVLYVQFRGNHDGPDGESITAFAAAVRQRLRTSTLRHVVLDQRLNRGGNADLTEDLMRDIGRWARGRLYVLLGPETFSAGIVSAALAVHEAGGQAVIVGDTVGDRLRWWSESAPAVCLPNSGYCLHGSTGLWDLLQGCAQQPHCYGDRFRAQVPGLAPALRAPTTVADWLAGRDAAMEALERDLSLRY